MYKKLYLLLFRRITRAIEALRRGEIGETEAILIRAQQDAEALYMEETEDCR